MVLSALVKLVHLFITKITYSKNLSVVGKQFGRKRYEKFDDDSFRHPDEWVSSEKYYKFLAYLDELAS